jgi:Tfp pilus assembly protein PilX
MRQPELKIKRARGFLLIVAILLLVVVAVAIVALGYMTSADIRASSGHAQSEQAYFAAQSGIEVAIYQFSQLDTPCASLVSAGNTNVAVGAGRFTITSATPYGPFASTLNGAIATTGPGVITTATSLANWAPHGRIRIADGLNNDEEIDYSFTSSSAALCGAAFCLVAWRRGANATTASTHLAGKAVLQDTQCLIRSTGTAGTATRIMEATVK